MIPKNNLSLLSLQRGFRGRRLRLPSPVLFVHKLAFCDLASYGRNRCRVCHGADEPGASSIDAVSPMVLPGFHAHIFPFASAIVWGKLSGYRFNDISHFDDNVATHASERDERINSVFFVYVIFTLAVILTNFSIGNEGIRNAKIWNGPSSMGQTSEPYDVSVCRWRWCGMGMVRRTTVFE